MSPTGPHRALRTAEGAACIAGASILWTIESTIVRANATEIALVQIIVFRVIGQVLFVLPWFLIHGYRKILATDRLPVHAMRGSLSLAGWWTYYYSVGVLPLAISTLVSFANVPFAVALAAPLLKEHVGRVRWGATILGLIGVLIAVQPAGLGALPAIAAGVVSACLGGATILTTRYLSAREDPRTIMTYISLVTAAGTLPLALPLWDQVSFDVPLVTYLVIFIAPWGMWLMILGYRFAEASAVAPVSYIRLVFAGAFGWYFFGENFFEGPLLVGAVIVVGAVLFLTLYERGRAPRDL